MFLLKEIESRFWSLGVDYRREDTGLYTGMSVQMTVYMFWMHAGHDVLLQERAETETGCCYYSGFDVSCFQQCFVKLTHLCADIFGLENSLEFTIAEVFG